MPGFGVRARVEFVFTTEQTVRRADEITAYLRGPRLGIPREDYPDFDNWLEKAYRQLKSEEKRAIVALAQGEIVGVVLYQQHRSLLGTLEMKTIAIRPDQRGRFIASFLLRNAEVEGIKDYATNRILVDAKVSNQTMRKFLLANGYQIDRTEDLYRQGAGEDVVYQKFRDTGPDNDGL